MGVRSVAKGETRSCVRRNHLPNVNMQKTAAEGKFISP